MIIGTSIGAAINGLRPVAEIQFADFILPAFNQLVSEAARIRYRSNNGYSACRWSSARRTAAASTARSTTRSRSRRSSPTCRGSRS